jgi:hypothetical protein
MITDVDAHLRKVNRRNGEIAARQIAGHDSEFPHTVSGIVAREDLTQRRKQKICGENAAQLLNL